MNEEVMNNVVVETPTKKKREKKKKSKARKIVEWVLFAVFGAIFIFILAGNINGEVHKKENYGQSIRFGIGSFVVLTDSMEPEIPTDSAIITYKQDVVNLVADFNAGQTIDLAFADVYSNFVPVGFVPDGEDFQIGKGNRSSYTNKVMTHRLREIHIREEVEYGKGRYIFVASGINDKGIASFKGQYQTFTENEYLGTVKVTNVFLGKVFRFIVSPIGLIIVLLIPAAYLIIVSSIDIFKAMKSSEEEESASVNGDVPSGNTLASVSSKDRERLKKELLEEMINKKKEEKNEKQD